jgi:thioredoxin 1
VSADVSVAQLTDATFQAEVLEAATPVLVDVWAAWSAREYAGRMVVGKLEADANPVCRDSLGIQGLPTLIVFRNGEELARHEGAMAQPQLKAFLDAHL